jgi:hypothetical protein
MGWDNALPAEVSGGTTHIKSIYDGLRKAVGEGGSAPNQEGLEGAWRAAKAQAIAASLDAYERAVLQALPFFAGEHIPVYERLLAIAPGEDQNDEDRRLAVVQAWTLRLFADMSELNRALNSLSPKLELEELDYDHVVYTLFGRMFPEYGAEASDGVPQYPNYSTDFILRVTYTYEFGETSMPRALRAQVGVHLNAVLPSWMDWRIFAFSATRRGLICNGGQYGLVLNRTPLSHS